MLHIFLLLFCDWRLFVFGVAGSLFFVAYLVLIHTNVGVADHIRDVTAVVDAVNRAEAERSVVGAGFFYKYGSHLFQLLG